MTVTDHNRIPEVVRALEDLNGTKVKAGVLSGGKIGMIAHVQEYGATIVPHNPTGYLWVPMKDGSYRKLKRAVIPARSFIRSTAIEKGTSWTRMAVEAFHQAVQGEMATGFGQKIGKQMETDIRDKVNSIQSPPNAPLTLANKAGGKPLIDTGGLLGSITHEVNK